MPNIKTSFKLPCAHTHQLKQLIKHINGKTVGEGMQNKIENLEFHFIYLKIIIRRWGRVFSHCSHFFKKKTKNPECPQTFSYYAFYNKVFLTIKEKIFNSSLFQCSPIFPYFSFEPGSSRYFPNTLNHYTALAPATVESSTVTRVP